MTNFRFAIRNIKRNKSKTFLMIIVSSILVIFLMYYIFLLNSNNYKLDKVYESNEVLVKVERKDGSTVKKEIPYIEMKNIAKKSGLVGKAYYTGEYKCSLNKNGVQYQEDVIYLVPTSDISREIVVENFKSNIEFADEYDESIFATAEKNICIVSRELLEKHSWKLGQKITLYAPNKSIVMENIAEFIVVGVYEINSQSNFAVHNTSYFKNAIYCAVDPFSVIAQTFYNTEDSLENQEFVLTETEFILNDSRKSEEFKNYIKMNTGYYTASATLYRAETLVIYDSDLKSIIGPMQSITNFMENTLPIIYIIIGIIAFCISYLMTQNRITDIALMRAMGLKSIKIYNIIINEISILSMLGICLGLVFSITVFSNFFAVVPNILNISIVTLIYLVTYLIGTTICLLIILKIKPIEILTKKE